MKKQIDFILLGTLWVLATILGTSFWFNTQFGFNILSTAHWRYLATLQASGTPVRPIFYVSVIVAVVIIIGGLYLLMLPRIRGLRLGARRRLHDRAKVAKDASQSTTPLAVPQEQNSIETAPVAVAPSPGMRPPRLNFGTVRPKPIAPSGAGNTPGTSPADAPQTPALRPANDAALAELKRIFESAGYLVKPSPRIAGLALDLFAVGMGENLWMGGIGANPTALERSVKRISDVFTDTLDDIPIHIHAFTIGTDMTSTDTVLVFPDIPTLGQYMADHPATTVPPESREDFDAYNEYIDTVSNYLNTTQG